MTATGGRPIEPTVKALRVVQWWDTLPRKTRIVTVVLPTVLSLLIALAWGWAIGQHHHQFDLRLYYDAVNWWMSGHDLFSYSQPDPVNIELGFTYPPLSAVVMAPMGVLPYPVVLALSLTAIVVCAALFVFLVLRERLALPRTLLLAATGVGTGFAFLLEPFRQTFSFGQINIYLALLVAFDLLVLGRRGSRWTGIGIGLATAIKLTPGIFIVYLLLTRRWRAAATAATAAVAATLFGAVFAPSETWRYFTSIIFDTSRVGFIDSTMNQSVNGLLARLSDPLPPSGVAWLALGGAIAAVGLWRARRAALAGDELAGMTLAGLAGVLISPVSWVHHIIWLFPAMLLIALRLTAAVRSLLHDSQPGSGRTERALTVRIIEVVVCSLLITVGLVVWCLPANNILGTYTPDFEGGGPLLAIAASLQLLWLVVAVVAVPVRDAGVASPWPVPGTAADARVGGQSDAPAAVSERRPLGT